PSPSPSPSQGQAPSRPAGQEPSRAQGVAIDWDVLQLQASRSRPILHMHRLAAENPIWLVNAWRVDASDDDMVRG
ncbi:MAG: cobalamin biosynthesis bifunctional protein CbiET, partial [Lautropia sp.]|nr:cobalamin biosynthesis bifunctional protein CbiET [Lautropia sp.]